MVVCVLGLTRPARPACLSRPFPPRYFRPTEVDLFIGDPAKAKKLLGWEPEITFEALVQEMVAEDMKLVESGDLMN